LLDYARSAFHSVYLCKLFHSYGKLDALDTGWNVDEDAWWSMVYDALEATGTLVSAISDDWKTQYYLSSPEMMEYYRHCRTYCKTHGVSLKDNPFMKKAEEQVNHMLQELSGNYGWTLLTRINHQWASGIVFYHDDYFDAYAYMELIEALLEIFHFYETELEALRQIISNLEPTKTKKEAA